MMLVESQRLPIPNDDRPRDFMNMITPRNIEISKPAKHKWHDETPFKDHQDFIKNKRAVTVSRKQSLSRNENKHVKKVIPTLKIPQRFKSPDSSYASPFTLGPSFSYENPSKPIELCKEVKFTDLGFEQNYSFMSADYMMQNPDLTITNNVSV